MQVDTVASGHVMPVTWIDEVVGMCSSIDTSTEESIAVLRHTDRVVTSDDDLQFALQVTGTLGEVRVL